MQQSDVIIIGGGLAGLTAAIHLAKHGIAVLLLEKEGFPQHKVCGEYVSKEILPYFEQLDLPLQELSPVDIRTLKYSTSRGNSTTIELPLGGMGISRYAFDAFLYRHAIKNEVEVVKETAITVRYDNSNFLVESLSGRRFSAKVVLGAYGKRSNLDKALNRSFIQRRSPWLAFKNHYRSVDFETDQVALHNFKGGYCGLSRTETGAVNVCYLTSLRSFKVYKDPEKFEMEVLQKNPFLKSFFEEATPLLERPLSIAQISFSSKQLVENHILFIGDAAGLLHPLCGNGMAMAIHSAKIASELVLQQFRKGRNQMNLEQEYSRRWRQVFRRRLTAGKWLQEMVVNQRISEISLTIASKFPSILEQIIKRTHGTPIK